LLDPRDVKYIVVHCSATPPTADIGVADIDKWHRSRGWDGIGYHLVIKRDGVVQPGRKLNTPGAHAEGYNKLSVGVCMVGGVAANNNPENNFTQAQFDSLASVLFMLSAKFPGAEILGHRDLPGVTKACPSFDVRAWLNNKDK
jgi:N-acetylmuramoyl-L-alanine amidase